MYDHSIFSLSLGNLWLLYFLKSIRCFNPTTRYRCLFMMDDKTLNFMFFMKYWLPNAHDNFCAMVYISPRFAREVLKEILKVYGRARNMPWTVNEINLWAVKKALVNGKWESNSPVTQKACKYQVYKTEVLPHRSV